MTAIGYTANHPLYWITWGDRRLERVRRRCLKMCERAARKAINAVMTKCVRHLLARPENVLIALCGCETALDKLITERGMIEAVPYYVEITETIERTLDRLVRLETEGRVKFTLIETADAAAD